MRKKQSPRVLAGAGLVLAMAMTGCSTGTDDKSVAEPGAAVAEVVPEQVPPEAEPLLERYGLTGMDTAEVIDHLDRLSGDDRPADLMASVRSNELIISSGEQEFTLDIPRDRFYLAFAPYVDQTHECFYHSLTTCTGELASAEVRVQIVDKANDKVVIDETTTTFENGFVGLWLPRDMEGTLWVSYNDKAGEIDITTDDDAPTCVTTLQLT